MAKKKEELKEEIPVEEVKTEEVVEEVPTEEVEYVYVDENGDPVEESEETLFEEVLDERDEELEAAAAQVEEQVEETEDKQEKTFEAEESKELSESTVTETGKKHPVRKALVVFGTLVAAGIAFLIAAGSYQHGVHNTKKVYEPKMSDVEKARDEEKTAKEAEKTAKEAAEKDRDEWQAKAVALANKLGLANADLAALDVVSNNIINNLGIIGVTRANMNVNENGEIVAGDVVIKLSETGFAKDGTEAIVAEDFATTNDKLLFTLAVLESGAYNQALTAYYQGIVAEKDANIATLNEAIDTLTAAKEASDARIAELEQAAVDAEAAHQTAMEEKEAEYRANLDTILNALAEEQTKSANIQTALDEMTADRDAEKAAKEEALQQLADIDAANNEQNQQNINNNNQGNSQGQDNTDPTLVADDDPVNGTPTGVADTGFGISESPIVIVNNNNQPSTTNLTIGGVQLVLPTDTAAQVMGVSDEYMLVNGDIPTSTEYEDADEQEEQQEEQVEETEEEYNAFGM